MEDSRKLTELTDEIFKRSDKIVKKALLMSLGLDESYGTLDIVKAISNLTEEQKNLMNDAAYLMEFSKEYSIVMATEIGKISKIEKQNEEILRLLKSNK